jgi:4-aminobutyrate aminotransferase-like enzyme
MALVGSELARIVSATHDTLTDASGHRLIDLFSANGAALLGHAHPHIAEAIKAQLDGVWLTGGLPTPALDLAKATLEAMLPDRLGLAGFYTTGMEAAEFAMRMARVHTGRTDFVGFSCAMHGKSSATAALSWDNAQELPHVHRLPLPKPGLEAVVLAQVAHCLRTHPIAAVFIEPVMGTGGGYVASAVFCDQLIALCHANGALVVMDEILTGFYRTGPLWAFMGLRELPDIVLLGKALANSFPASAVVARRDIRCTPPMLPGSTYAGNPLAAVAISATLRALALLDMTALVSAIGSTVQVSLSDIPGVVLRGRGALWMIETSSALQARQLAETLYARGVFISYTGKYLRLLPSATIDAENLTRACQLLRDLLLECSHA